MSVMIVAIDCRDGKITLAESAPAMVAALPPSIVCDQNFFFRRTVCLTKDLGKQLDDHLWFKAELEAETGTTLVKPPLGITPRTVALEHFNHDRMRAIAEGIRRYDRAGHKIPTEWLDELSELLA